MQRYFPLCVLLAGCRLFGGDLPCETSPNCPDDQVCCDGTCRHTCTDPAVDACAADPCGEFAACSPDGGMSICTCLPGYFGDGIDCAALAECETSAANCDALASCVEIQGSRVCICNAGYTGDGAECLDIDECSLPTASTLCNAHGACANTVGGHDCNCSLGYAGADCQYANATTCSDHGAAQDDGSCICGGGWTGPSCADVDQNPCNSGGQETSPGVCQCFAGYAGTTCQYSDAVTCNGRGTVDDAGVCTCDSGNAGSACEYSDALDCNGDGAAQADGSCLCNSGFAGPRCEYSDAVTCSGNGTAQTDGSCNCDPFYEPSTPGGCADIEECLVNNGDCGDSSYSDCVNNVGAAPTCNCQPEHFCSGSCIDLLDVNNCGSCDVVCDPTNTTLVECISTACVLTCDTGHVQSGDSCVPMYHAPDIPPRAFDVAPDGSAVLVGLENGEVKVRCFDSDGLTSKSTSTIHTYDDTVYTTFFQMDVAIARTSRDVAISWNYADWPTPSNDWQTWVAHLDANCDQVGTARLLDPAPVVGVNRPADVRISDDGKSAFIYEAQSAGEYRLIINRADGVNQSAISIGPCRGGSLGRRIGMRRTTGDIVVACELGNTKFYQRFDASGVPVDASLIAAPELELTAGPWSNDGFLIEYNDDGYMIYASIVENSSLDDWRINFYQPDMTLITTVDQTSDSQYPTNNRILITSSGEFVTPISDGSLGRQIYRRTGVLVSESADADEIRIDASDIVYRLNASGRRIEKNPYLL